jgi:hypothetical protein
MSPIKKIVLGLLGVLALVLVGGQLVLGQMIMAGPNNVSKLIKMHQHTGYTAVAISGIYILASLYAIFTAPARVKS